MAHSGTMFTAGPRSGGLENAWQCGASPANSQILLRTGRPAVAQFYLIGEVCKLHSVRGLPQTSKKDDSLRAKKNVYIYIRV